jgi:hypothetical protein
MTEIIHYKFGKELSLFGKELNLSELFGLFHFHQNLISFLLLILSTCYFHYYTMVAQPKGLYGYSGIFLIYPLLTLTNIVTKGLFSLVIKKYLPLVQL